MMYKKQTNHGFTLIEVIVVTSIISVLSSVVLTVFTSPRQRARDTQRILELRQLQNALELYYSTNQSYPDSSVATGGCPTSVGNLATCPVYSTRNLLPTPIGSDWDSASPLRQLVTGRFISRLPVDPLNKDGFWYIYRGRPQGYVLEATLENGTGIVRLGGTEAAAAWVDVNSNGVVTGADATLILQYCSGVTPTPGLCTYLRDYDCDGTYTSNDVTRAQEYVTGLRPITDSCRS